jgi:acyl carrier protein
MTHDEIRQVVLGALGAIAPEADLSQLRGDLDVRDQLDIDSMDHLNFLIAVHTQLSVDIPEADYPLVQTLDGLLGYLEARLGTS